MEGNTTSKNENVQSYINTIDDDDIKTSVPVAEKAETIVNEGKQTVKRICRAVENTASSNSNLIDHNTTTMSSSFIIEVDPIVPSTNVQPCTTPTTNQIQSQMNTITTNHRDQQLDTRKHIMISYNRATATTVCQKIYDRLTENNYTVWFDRKKLTYGSIIDAMGDAVDNAYVVLLCMNEGYSKSLYCLKEAKYAVESKVPVIPCMMEEKFRPRSGLGYIKCDLKHIEFFDDDKFDESFEELTNQIDAITAGSEMRSVIVDNRNFRDRFDTILTEHMESIQNCYLRQRNLNETELWTVLRRFIEEFSPETWQSFQNDPLNDVDDRQIQAEDNDRFIQHLLVNNEKIAELVRIQRENHAQIEQHLLNQDERLAAFQIFQQRQEQEHVRSNHNERLLPLFNIQDMQRQGEERNDRIVRQLQQRIDQLTELVITQQERHAREMETMHQLVNRSLEASSNTQQQQTPYFDLGLLKDVIQTTVLLCTLLVLFKNR